jgi:hypothetical protein
MCHPYGSYGRPYSPHGTTKRVTRGLPYDDMGDRWKVRQQHSQHGRKTCGLIQRHHVAGVQLEILPLIECHMDQSNGTTWHLRESQVGLQIKIIGAWWVLNPRPPQESLEEYSNILRTSHNPLTSVPQLGLVTTTQQNCI